MTNDRTLGVLFVDDEARLLDGLRRTTHAHRTRWDMSYALGAGEALAIIGREPVDVIVSDMRMPGIDGAALLTEVARVSPGIIRVVLSGQTHEGAARRAARVAHQFLAKPIDRVELLGVIERLEIAVRLVPEPELRALCGAVSVLPGTQASYDRLRELCETDASTVAEFADVAEREPGLAARIVQLSGSAFFGRAFHSTRIADALSHLGVDTIRALGRDDQLLADPQGVCLEGRRREALLAATIARRSVGDAQSADDAYLAGLLAGVGRLIVGDEPDERTACRLGGCLLAMWGLPASVVAAVADADDVAPDAQARAIVEATREARRFAQDVTILSGAP